MNAKKPSLRPVCKQVPADSRALTGDWAAGNSNYPLLTLLPLVVAGIRSPLGVLEWCERLGMLARQQPRQFALSGPRISPGGAG